MNITFSTPLKSADSSPCVYVLERDTHFYSLICTLCTEKCLVLRVICRLTDAAQEIQKRAASCLLMDADSFRRCNLQLDTGFRNEASCLPVILITERPNLRHAVDAIKAGAVDYLHLPIQESNLSFAIDTALERASIARLSQQSLTSLLQRFRSLTPREHQVLALVATGYMNKQVASDLGVSEITVKIHRSNVMKKMSAKTLADLVRMAERLYACSGIPYEGDSYSQDRLTKIFFGSEDPNTPDYRNLRVALCQHPGARLKAAAPPQSFIHTLST